MSNTITLAGLSQVITTYKESLQQQKLGRSIANSKNNTYLKGLVGSSISIVIANAFRETELPFLLVLNDKEEAAYHLNDLEQLIGEKDVLFYPGSYRRPYQIEETDNANILLRAEVLNRINSRKKPAIIVTYPEALFEKVVTKKELERSTLKINLNDKLSIDFINETLFEYKFKRVDFVTEPGEFSVRGGIVDVFSFSNDEGARKNFGPYTPGFIKIPYDDTEALENALKQENVAGFLVEPIQGEAGVYTPADDFMKKAKQLCNDNNVLFIADEIQTGIARTGGLLAVCGNCSCENHCERQETYSRPDILILGKALSGGAYPVSAVLADDEIMNVIKPGQHGSTFGGNPVAAAVAMAALQVVQDENLIQNARTLGELFRSEMAKYIETSNIVSLVRGKGLLNAIVINDSEDSSTAWDMCMALKENGLLAKPTHGNIIRFAPPLVMTKEQLLDCVSIITETLKTFEK